MMCILCSAVASAAAPPKYRAVPLTQLLVKKLGGEVGVDEMQATGRIDNSGRISFRHGHTWYTVNPKDGSVTTGQQLFFNTNGSSVWIEDNVPYAQLPGNRIEWDQEGLQAQLQQRIPHRLEPGDSYQLQGLRLNNANVALLSVSFRILEGYYQPHGWEDYPDPDPVPIWRHFSIGVIWNLEERTLSLTPDHQGWAWFKQALDMDDQGSYLLSEPK